MKVKLPPDYGAYKDTMLALGIRPLPFRVWLKTCN